MTKTYSDLGYDKIFVALDGSDLQYKVLDRAITTAASDNAELYIGHVIDSTALETTGVYPSGLISALEEDFRNSIAEQIAKAQAEPNIKKVALIVKAGRIRETLKDEMLDEINPDLVVCGARGLSPIKYALLGSISTFLIRTAKVDTLVVK